MSKKALVTGAAGFIGSHLCEELINQGWQVIGIDCFTSYYNRALKERNISILRSKSNFTFIEKDLLKAPLKDYLKGVDFVFHQAGQPGVRESWGKEFDIYVKNNIIATQHLLECVKNYDIKKFVFASSSSVYGNTDLLPMKESQLPKPHSPYGLTKLASEQLCQLYHVNYRVPVIALRYFTVYGPRQRPEMAISSFIEKIIEDQSITIYGDGSQGRDFTYIDDIIRANLLAAQSSVEGETFNVGSGNPVKLREVIGMLEKITGKCVQMNFRMKQKGDVKDTFADISKIKNYLGFEPQITLQEGLGNQVEYVKKRF